MIYDDLLFCSRWVFISYDGKPQRKTTIGRIFVPTSTMNHGDAGCFFGFGWSKIHGESHCSAQLCFFSPGIAEVGRCWDVARKIPWWISGDVRIFRWWTCQSNRQNWLKVFNLPWSAKKNAHPQFLLMPLFEPPSDDWIYVPWKIAHLKM